MQFLYFLENLRCGFLDFFFSLTTLFGEETFFMVIGLIVFWCFNKQQGYYLLGTGFAGTLINQTLKMSFRVPRPWIKDPNFTIVESAREGASGFSFPSGHTQTSVGIFSGLFRWNKVKWLRIVCIVMCVLVPLSRMYLGVHTPLDVGVSIVIALGLSFGFYPLFIKAENNTKIMYALLFGLFLMTVGFFLFVNLFNFPEEVYLAENLHNLQSAQKNAYTLLGCSVGLILTYFIDNKYTKFDTKAVWWAQILKVLGGIVCVLIVKELLRSPLEWIFNHELIARAVRYFLIVVVAGILWPMTFKWFGKLGKK